MAIASRRARLYESIRTAHLERALQLAPAAIVYRVRRYDFDESLAERLELVQAGPLRAAVILRRARLETLEVNEPLMLSALPSAALAVFAVRFARPRPPRIVSYAIGNADPFGEPTSRLRRRIRRHIERRLASWTARHIDAIAYGTDGARETYRKRLGPLPAREVTIPALPARGPDRGPKPDPAVVFLGAFVARKGLPLLLEAWPSVLARRPEATLSLVGKGTLAAEVQAWALERPEVSIDVDPPRERIRDVLAASRVLVLPSQPSPTWREQVGLPIVEGLEQGCAIVTTTETGLADWLLAHGHGVVPGTATAAVLADAIVGQLDGGDRSAEIRASLPDRDGRLAADAWLFGDAHEQGSARHV